MKYTVTDVTRETMSGGIPVWRVAYAVTDGPSDESADTGSEVPSTAGVHVHIFPEDTLEWRAAEYGIPLDDTATLLDIVLAEPFIPADEFLPGTNLHDAPSIDEARTHHVGRCARAKLKVRLSTRAVDDAGLHRVRTESPLHHEVVTVKAEIVRRARRDRSLVAAAAVAEPLSGAARAAALRGHLSRVRGEAV